jgi:hypothetical protein
MKLVWCAVAVVLAFAVPTGAQEKKDENKLSDEVVKALEKADAVEVYSLDGELDGKDTWRGAKVLGKTEVKGEKAQKALADAVKKGVTEGDRGARCFIPRHGLRVTHDKKTYDLVICFECGWLYLYTDKSDKPQVLLISSSPQSALNKILTDAKVKIAKPEK